MTKHIAILRKVLAALLGGSLLLIGVAMIALPGPATIVIPLALAVMAIEFACARRWQAQFRERINSMLGRRQTDHD